MKRFFIAFSLSGLLFLNATVHGQQATTATAALDKEMATKANAFLRTLPDSLRAKAAYSFDDDERYDWHFVPRKRNGVPLRMMNETQQKAALALLQTGLTESGYAKAQSIMALESTLKQIEKLPPENLRRDPLNYSFTIFGNPSDQEPWGWRVEGHHLILNYSSIRPYPIAFTPGFMGSNPAIVPDGSKKGKQVLKQEAGLGYALLKTFSPDQLKRVVIADTSTYEIITGHSRKMNMGKAAGMPFVEMTAPQKQAFRQLLEVYLGNYPKTLANFRTGQLEKDGFDKLHFAWAGSTDRSKGHYYRIQGSMLMIEFDNTQNNSNHIHTVVRDLNNDFGEDLLQEHYKQHAHGK